MANPKHLEILNQGVEVWNNWRSEHATVKPDLSHAGLNSADLRDANLMFAVLIGADLRNANAMGASFNRAELRFARFINSNLRGADLSIVDLREADLTGADLIGATMLGASLNATILNGANFKNVHLSAAMFANIDLSEVKGLEAIKHLGPSDISINTLYKSGGKIPEAFLRGCGVPDEFITFLPSILGAQQAIQFYSCFISYSSKDEEFARRLYSRMRDEKLRVWFAPEDIKGGEKLHEQIERAIQVHDRLLIVLSEESMRSEWVITEIKRARRTEIREKRRKLFPIRLVDFETIQAWESFDADTGMDLAAEVRSYFIPDFSNWKEHDDFEKAFDRLLHDLRAEEGK